MTIDLSNNYCLKPARIFKTLVLLFFLFCESFGLRAASNESILIADDNIKIIDTIYFSGEELIELQDKRPNPVLQLFKIKQKKNKRITAAILAFPFPFGIVGLHRIYLGTSPHVPVVYIGTLGGIFGILPFIDFCVLVLDKNLDHYIENKQVFMWVNE